jgi:hypothetical protein
MNLEGVGVDDVGVVKEYLLEIREVIADIIKQIEFEGVNSIPNSENPIFKDYFHKLYNLEISVYGVLSNYYPDSSSKNNEASGYDLNQIYNPESYIFNDLTEEISANGKISDEEIEKVKNYFTESIEKLVYTIGGPEKILPNSDTGKIYKNLMNYVTNIIFKNPVDYKVQSVYDKYEENRKSFFTSPGKNDVASNFFETLGIQPDRGSDVDKAPLGDSDEDRAKGRVEDRSDKTVTQSILEDSLKNIFSSTANRSDYKVCKRND